MARYHYTTPEAFDRAAELFAQIQALREGLPDQPTLAAKLATRREIDRLVQERLAVLRA